VHRNGERRNGGAVLSLAPKHPSAVMMSAVTVAPYRQRRNVLLRYSPIPNPNANVNPGPSRDATSAIRIFNFLLKPSSAAACEVVSDHFRTVLDIL